MLALVVLGLLFLLALPLSRLLVIATLICAVLVLASASLAHSATAALYKDRLVISRADRTKNLAVDLTSVTSVTFVYTEDGPALAFISGGVRKLVPTRPLAAHKLAASIYPLLPARSLTPSFVMFVSAHPKPARRSRALLRTAKA